MALKNVIKQQEKFQKKLRDKKYVLIRFIFLTLLELTFLDKEFKIVFLIVYMNTKTVKTKK